MDDYWLDAARLRRRPWWDPAQAPDPEMPHQPVGLEAFRPPEPPAIGFDVQAPQPEPFEEFARSWLEGAEQDPGESRPEMRPPEPPRRWFDLPEYERASQAGGSEPRDPWLLGDISSGPKGPDREREEPVPRTGRDLTDWRQLASPLAVPASTGALARHLASGASRWAAAAGPAVVAAGKAIGEGLESMIHDAGRHATQAAALLAPLHAPRLLGNTEDRAVSTTDLGNGYRLVEQPDATASIQESDNGWLGTGFGASSRTLPVDARVVPRPDGTREYAIDWEGLQARIGYDKTLEAMQKLAPEMAQPRRGAGDPPPPKDKLPIAFPIDETRRLLKRFPDLIRRDTDSWALDGVEPTEAELEHARLCERVQKARGKPAPDSEYKGNDALETIFGPVGPKVGSPEATTRPGNARHDAGVRGEMEMVGRIHNVEPSEHIVIYGRPPGINGPDGITISDKYGSIMCLESKYLTDPNSVGLSSVPTSCPAPGKVKMHLEDAVNSGRVPVEVATAAE